MPFRMSEGLRDKLLTTAADGGKSLAELMSGGVIQVRTGSQPATANAVETGTLLFTVTLDPGGDIQTSGALVDGDMYRVVDAGGASKDFSNVTSETIALHLVFVATADAEPTNWDGVELRKEVGLSFEAASDGKIEKDSGVTWKGIAVAGGSAGWFRFYDAGFVAGASTSEVRFDGHIATSGGQMNMVTTTVAEGSSQTVDQFEVSIPA